MLFACLSQNQVFFSQTVNLRHKRNKIPVADSFHPGPTGREAWGETLTQDFARASSWAILAISLPGEWAGSQKIRTRMPVLTPKEDMAP
jgi:hypothetical protein